MSQSVECTPEIEAIIRAQRGAAPLQSVELLAEHIGVAVGTLGKWLRQLDIPMVQRRRYSVWDLHPEKVEQLHALWPIMACADIGRKLGVSKDAVIGKAHREGLPPKQRRTPQLVSPSRYTSGGVK